MINQYGKTPTWNVFASEKQIKKELESAQWSDNSEMVKISRKLFVQRLKRYNIIKRVKIKSSSMLFHSHLNEMCLQVYSKHTRENGEWRVLLSTRIEYQKELFKTRHHL